MKQLSKEEQKFLKETKFTATAVQMDDYKDTVFKDWNEAFHAAKTYNVDLVKLTKNICNPDEDCISLEMAAPYLLTIFFTQSELAEMSNKDILKFLQDFKYFFGWRKADEYDAAAARYDADKLFDGLLKLSTDFGDEVWLTENENT